MSRFLNPRYRALQAYTPGEQPRDQHYIKLNTNESPYPPAPAVRAALKGADLEDLRLYPDPEGTGLKQKLAALYGVEPSQLFLSNGSDDILNFAFMAFAPQAGAAFPDITYGFYPVFAALQGVPFEEIPLKSDFSVDPESYEGCSRMVVLANPNAPTGKTLAAAQIAAILEKNPDTVVVLDEAYVDFGAESCYPLIRQYENLLVVRTFSKSRCFAGGRLGYAFGSPALIADLEKLRYSTNPYNINRLTLKLGEATVEEEAYYRVCCEAVAATREQTAKDLAGLGFEVLPSKANFLFARHPALPGKTLYQELKKRGILVRHFDWPRIDAFNRITIGTPEQMEQLLETIAAMLKGASL